MTITPSNIVEGQWSRYDLKEFVIHIEGEELSNVSNVRFVILTRPNGSILLEKETGAGIVIDQDENNEWRNVIVTVGDDEADYENIPSNVYHWELYDVDSNLKIGEGSATLGPGLPPSES